MNRSPLLLALASVLAFPAQAGAAGVQIAPSILDVPARAGARIPPVALINRSGQELAVRAGAVPMGQALDGMPVYRTSPAAFAAGRRIVGLDRQAFTVPAHTTLRVQPRVNPGTMRRAGVYAALIFTAQPPAGQATRKGATVVARLRMVAPLLMQLPGRVLLRGGVTAVQPRQGKGRTLDFVTRLVNTGNLHKRIPATLRITDGRGRARVTRPLDPTLVIPGARRELITAISAPLPAGRYRATVTSRFGGRETTASSSFVLVGPNRLPAPKLVLGSIRADGARPGRPFDLTFRAANIGTAAFRGSLAVTITPAHGGRVLRLRADAGALRSGTDGTRRVRVPGRRAGQYRVEVRAASGGFELARAGDEIEVRNQGPRVAALWRRLQAHLFQALLTLVTLVAVGTAMAATRRARRLGA